MRKLVWIKSERVESWVCSDCTWAFRPSGPPLGKSLEEMKENFERQRDTEFTAHACAKHPRTQSHEP